MSKKGLIKRMLAGILCAAMVLPSLTVNAYADEVTVISSETETESESEAVKEYLPTESIPITDEISTEEVDILYANVKGTVTADYSITGFWIDFDSITYTPSPNLKDVSESQSAGIQFIDADGNNMGEVIENKIYLYYYGGATKTAEKVFYYYVLKGAKKFKLIVPEKYADGTTGSAESDAYDIDKFPSIEISVSNPVIGYETAEYTVEYSGNLEIDDTKQIVATTEFIGGSTTDPTVKPDDESTWKVLSESFCRFTTDADTKTMQFSGLPSGKSLFGKIRFYVGNEHGIAFEKEVPVEAFTTLKSNKHNLNEEIPDEALRTMIISKLGGTIDPANVSSANLEAIKDINISDSGIKSLEGIDLLSSIESLYADGNDISTLEGIDWSQFTKLKQIQIRDNKLKNLPDLSNCATLSYIYMTGNMIPEAELLKVREKLPKECTADIFRFSLSKSNQRVKDVEIVTEDTYYDIAGKTYLAYVFEGITKKDAKAVKEYIDETEAKFESKGGNAEPYYRIYADTKSLSVGKHTLKVLFSDGSYKEASFNVVKKDALFDGIDKSYIPSDMNDKEAFSVGFMGASLSSITKAEIISTSGDVIATSEYRGGKDFVPVFSKLLDYGFTYVNLIKDADYGQGSFSFEAPKYNLDPGEYDFTVTYSDGTKKTYDKAIVVTDEPIIREVQYYSNVLYCNESDNFGDYVYANIVGYNLDPSRLEYSMDYDGKNIDLSYVSYKKFPNTESRVGDMYTVKLEKKDSAWGTKYPKASFFLNISPKSGYSVNKSADSYPCYVCDGLYFFDVNGAKGRFEAGITKDRFNDIDDIKIWRQKIYADEDDYAKGEIIDIDRTDDSQNGFVILKPKNLTDLSGEHLYTVEIIYKHGKTEIKSIEIRTWDTARDVPILKDESLSEAIDSMNALHNSYEIEEESKFLIKDDSLSGVMWKDDETLSFGICRLVNKFTLEANKDDFKVELIGQDGKKVTGLTTTVSDVLYYDEGLAHVYLDVKGLKRSEAFKKYSFIIKHKTLGDLIYVSGDREEDFCSNYAKDVLIKSDEVDFHIRKKELETMFLDGVKLFKTVCPVKLKVFLPYGAEPVLEKEITEADLKKTDAGAWAYVFDDEILGKLPDKNGIYDVSAEWSRDSIVFYPSVALCDQSGASMPQPEKPSLSKDSVTLSLDDASASKDTVTVNNAKGTIKVESADNDIAKATVSDKTITITAVGEGTTSINVTVDGEKLSITVTVLKTETQVNSITITPLKDEVTVGNKAKFIVKTEPDAELSEGSSIRYEFDDSAAMQVVSGTEGKTLIAKALKPGLVKVTATLEQNIKGVVNSVSAFCNIRIKGVFAPGKAQREIGTKTIIYTGNDADVKLSSLKSQLPKGWSFDELENGSDPVLCADDDAPVKLFDVTYKDSSGTYEDYHDMLPVRITRIDSVTVSGESRVAKNSTETYRYNYTYTGFKPLSVSSEWTLSSKLKLAPGGSLTRTTVPVVIENAGKLSVKVEFDGKTVTADKDIDVETLTLKVSESAPENAVAYVVNGNTVEVKAEDVTKTSNRLMLSVDGAQEVTYTSYDPGVLTVDKTGLVTIKKAGVTLVQASSGEDSGTLLIKVLDYKPVLETKKVTVYQHKNNGILSLDFVAQNANAINAVTLSGAIGSGSLTPSCSAGKVSLKAENYTTNTTEKVKVSVETEKGTYEYDLTVVVDVTKPVLKSFTFKQTAKPNIFYIGEKTGNAEYKVTSKNYEIEDITVDSSETKYVLNGAYDVSEGLLSISVNGLTKANVAEYKPSDSVKLKIKVKGYDEEVITVALKTDNKKPVLKISEAIVSKEAMQGSAVATIMEGKNIVSTEGMTFEKLSGGADVSLLPEGTKLRVSKNGPAAKTGSYKATLSKAEWTGDVTASGKLTEIAKTSSLAITPSVTKIVISSVAGHSEAKSFVVGVKGNDDLLVEGLTAKSSNTALVTTSVRGRTITVTPVGSATKGTAKITLTGMVGNKPIKKATVTVTINDKTPAVSYSAKGKINIASRATSPVTVTPKLSNTTSDVAVDDMKITAVGLVDGKTTVDVSNSAFTLEVVDGKAVVTANPYVKLVPSKKYKVTIESTLSNTMTVTNTVLISTENKLPKLKVTTVSGNGLYKSNAEQAVVYSVPTTPGYEISEIRDASNMDDKFDIEVVGQDIMISLKSGGKRIKSGKYSLKFKVYFRDADSSKPVSVTCPVVVK